MIREELNDFFENKNINFMEGGMFDVPEQFDLIYEIISSTSNNIENICEVGFHAGHSAALFLNTCTNAKVVSFDLGVYYYCDIGKQFIDDKFPNRHTLIKGDSKIEIPKQKFKYLFDVIFIDGGHDYDTCYNDFKNLIKKCHEDTIIIFDDVVKITDLQKEWNVHPTKVWCDALENNEITEISNVIFKDGRGMAWGKIK